MSCSERAFRLQASKASLGFSYLWVLMTVAFMGLGLVLAADIASTASQRDKEKELLAIGRQFRTAIASYYETQLSAGRRDYPATLEDLVQDKRFPGMKRHLRKVFVDPMTGRAEWGLIRIGGRIVGVHSLSDSMPIKQANFDAQDMGLAGKQKYSEWIFAYPSDVMVRMGAEAAQALATGASKP